MSAKLEALTGYLSLPQSQLSVIDVDSFYRLYKQGDA
jgi:hypothetical protein